MDPAIRVSELYVYPLKSGAGISLDVMSLDVMGPRFDRRWMLVDDAGRFISQREEPRLSLVKSALQGGTLVVSALHREPLAVPPTDPEAPRIQATVWSDVVDVVHVSCDADAWFSELLETRCRLVYFPDDSIRVADRTFNPEGRRVGLADGFPLLLIGAASIAELNERIVARGGYALPMNRFRPNLVVEGSSPWAEDDWQSIEIGEGSSVHMSIVKSCARCAIPTVDQNTALRGKEPLATLATYRRGPDGSVYVGQNVIHERPGVIRVGDPVAFWRAS